MVLVLSWSVPTDFCNRLENLTYLSTKSTGSHYFFIFFIFFIIFITHPCMDLLPMYIKSSICYLHLHFLLFHIWNQWFTYIMALRIAIISYPCYIPQKPCHLTSGTASLNLMLGHTHFYNATMPCYVYSLATSMLVHTWVYLWLLFKNCIVWL